MTHENLRRGAESGNADGQPHWIDDQRWSRPPSSPGVGSARPLASGAPRPPATAAPSPSGDPRQSLAGILLRLGMVDAVSLLKACSHSQREFLLNSLEPGSPMRAALAYLVMEIPRGQ